MEFEDDGRTAWLQINGGRTSVVIANNGGAKAQSQARHLSGGPRWDERIKGSFWMEKTRT